MKFWIYDFACQEWILGEHATMELAEAAVTRYIESLPLHVKPEAGVISIVQELKRI